ncbi:MAG: PQQ-like beta-propeller repeat protein [Planctomycetaceae bacterium]|nr:PQQ-like beta-propeller repeat protein [Planctomycetaceae bacterium]
MDRETAIGRYGIAGYQAAIGTAIVGGVFAVVIAALLGVHLYRYHVTDPRDAAALEKMKEQAKAYPADQTLSQEIVVLDARLRRDQLARLQFLKRGTFLLVGAAALCVGALIWSGGYNRLPLPCQRVDRKAEQITTARRIRTALTFSLVIAASGSLFWSLYTPAKMKLQNGDADKQAAGGPALEEDRSFAAMDEIVNQWPCFRGPQGLGISPFKDIPIDWDSAGGKNIKWKSSIPLEGHSSPVVWQNRIYVTGANADQQQVFCFDADTGKLLWTGDVAVADKTGRADMNISEDTGYAASTPVTDGRRVCAIFAGGDIACFTVNGRLLWQKSLGIPDSMYGYASSLTFYEDAVIVQWDVGSEPGQSRLIAFDWQTGQIKWQTPRPVPNSWSSPTVARVAGIDCVLTAASPFVIAYEPKTGREMFKIESVEGDIASTPIVADNRIFALEPYQKLVAIEATGASGNLTAAIAWQADGAMPDICSPIADGPYIWTLDSGGELSCYKVADGSKAFSASLKLQFEASPSLAAGRLYLLSTTGTMVIADAAGAYKEIGRCSINEPCFATPAFAEGRIYIRAKTNLFCIGAK